MQRIVLASASQQRKNLLASLGIPFEVIPAEIDEKQIRDGDLAKQAEKIARAKAEKIAANHDAIIIAGDTYSLCQGQVLEKPRDGEDAKRMLRILSNGQGVNYNGFCYIDKNHQIDFSTTVEVEFKFRELSDWEIENYVSQFPVTSWAAGFSPAYLYPMTMITYLKGSLTGFTHGLPMELVINYLTKSGIAINPKKNERTTEGL